MMLKGYEVKLLVKVRVTAKDEEDAVEMAFDLIDSEHDVELRDIIELDYPNEDYDRERYLEEKYANN